MLRLFVHTFTAYDKYSLLNRDNLKQLIEMQLSQKEKNFCKEIKRKKVRLTFFDVKNKQQSYV